MKDDIILALSAGFIAGILLSLIDRMIPTAAVRL